MSHAGASSPSVAAFFDIDGTLTKTTIVHYYVFFRKRRLPRLLRGPWTLYYLIRCLLFMLLDRVDRSLFNRVFYRSYRGMSVQTLQDEVSACYRQVVHPRYFKGAQDCVAGHREAGRSVVLVTGSIDFMVAPIAKALHADHVIASSLETIDGRCTGRLDGPPVGDQEKARRITELAQQYDLDLSRSYAYGDSRADLAMLECVGFPQAVNPDRILESIARDRGWPVHRWPVGTLENGGA